jgi:phage terminase large subunit-like protein
MTTHTQATVESLMESSYEEALALYADLLSKDDREELRWACQNDRFFLLVYGMGRGDVAHPWIYDRCREVEKEPENSLDLWSRFHYKSTIISLAGTVQEILRNPEITIGIFGHVLSLSKKRVAQIQRTLESTRLIYLFPEILHDKPPMRGWSAENGLIVKRKGNPNEPTVQACGLVDGQPIGAHYQLRIYDDIVTSESVSTPEQIAKTTAAWELSLALGIAEGGRAWYCGTRYHPCDTYSELIQRKVLKERRRICYDDDMQAVLMPQNELEKIRRDMGERTFAAQMLQDPIGEGMRTFRDTWFQTIDLTRMPEAGSVNRYILIDSANAKKKTNDYTVMWVVGLGRDKNYYVMDGLRDRLNLVERSRALFDLVEKWTPLCTFWEQVGLASDAQHIKEEQDRISWHFPIVEIGQTKPKDDRIKDLIPEFEASRIWFPSQMLRRTILGDTRDIVQDFINHEYGTHPVCKHDDMLDCLANIKHPTVAGSMRFPVAPRAEEEKRPPTRTVSSWKPLARKSA